MKKKSFAYNLINILVLLLAALIFFLNYNIFELFKYVGTGRIIVLCVTVVVVHFLKAVRLYLALHGSGISRSNYVKTYCKVTPVSILLPFKLGELFRMYCYGAEAGNMLKGTVTVLLDRFMDTIALVTMIVVLWIANGGTLVPIIYLFILFIIVFALIMLAYPGLYMYWKKYLLNANATPRKIKALKGLDKMNRVYEEIINVSRGRGIILYVLSIVAWAVEIGSVAVICNIDFKNMIESTSLTAKISSYLESAISGSQIIELKRFVLLSVIFMIVIYLVVKAYDTAKLERD